MQLYKDAFCEYFRYNDDGEISESEDSEGNTTHYEYDDNGNLISVTDEEGKSLILQTHQAMYKLPRPTLPMVLFWSRHPTARVMLPNMDTIRQPVTRTTSLMEMVTSHHMFMILWIVLSECHRS